MENTKNNVLSVSIVSAVVCIVVISHYLIDRNASIGVFGKIAIVCASFGLALNVILVLCSLGSKKNISKTILTTINIIIFCIVGFVTGVLIF